MQLRALATERLDDPAQRGLVLAAASDPAVLERLAAGEEIDAERFFGEVVAEFEAPEPPEPAEADA